MLARRLGQEGRGPQAPRSPARPDTVQAPFTPHASPLLCQPHVTHGEVTWERRRAALGACTVTCVNGVAVKPFGQEQAQHGGSAGKCFPRPLLRWPPSAKRPEMCGMDHRPESKCVRRPQCWVGAEVTVNGASASAAVRELDREKVDSSLWKKGRKYKPCAKRACKRYKAHAELRCWRRRPGGDPLEKTYLKNVEK